jgi:hypothetical protein
MQKSRKYLVGGVGSLALLFAVVLFGAFLYQQPRDREFVQSRLMPLVNHVESFREREGRLPSVEEFSNWAELEYENKALSYFPEKPDFLSDWGTPGEDFVVGAWRGEWNHFYSTWNGADFSDPR